MEGFEILCEISLGVVLYTPILYICIDLENLQIAEKISAVFLFFDCLTIKILKDFLLNLMMFQIEYFLKCSFKIHVQSMVKPDVKYTYIMHPSLLFNDPIYGIEKRKLKRIKNNSFFYKVNVGVNILHAVII